MRPRSDDDATGVLVGAVRPPSNYVHDASAGQNDLAYLHLSVQFLSLRQGGCFPDQLTRDQARRTPSANERDREGIRVNCG
jgi:hypothetical protein